jgi:hypothetical protein
MCRFVGIVIYQGLVEEVQIFETEATASMWLAQRRGEYEDEDTLDSLVWDVDLQLPSRTANK